MNEAIIVELRFFFTSVIWGMVLLIIYDVLRILRRVIKHNAFVISIQDIIYWVVSSVLIFHMMYNQNNGIIRGFAILAMLLGMIIYHIIFSDFLVDGISGIINKVISTIYKIIRKTIHILLSPFRFIGKKLMIFFRFIFKKLKKLGRFILNRLKKIRKSDKIAVSDNEKGD
jgi:spore cortex biosynthesis protein YabQ